MNPEMVKELRALQKENARLRKVVADQALEMVSHSRYVIFQIVEVAVFRSLFAEILARVRRLSPVGGKLRAG